MTSSTTNQGLDDTMDTKDDAKFLKRQPITLVVGGKKFLTDVATLTSAKSTFFANLFSTFEPVKEKTIALDLDPTYFGDILNYMRFGKIHISSMTIRRRFGVKMQADFLGMDKLSEMLKKWSRQCKYCKLSILEYDSDQVGDYCAKAPVRHVPKANSVVTIDLINDRKNDKKTQDVLLESIKKISGRCKGTDTNGHTVVFDKRHIVVFKHCQEGCIVGETVVDKCNGGHVWSSQSYR
jgi:hypothetical protein